MTSKSPKHFTSDEFREMGRATIDWIADYIENLEERSVSPDVEPGDVRSSLPERAPESPESFVDILDDVNSLIGSIQGSLVIFLLIHQPQQF